MRITATAVGATTLARPWRAPAAAPQWIRQLFVWLRPSFASSAFAGLWVAAGLARFGLLAGGFRLRLSEAFGLVVLVVIVLVARFRVAIPWRVAIYPVIYVAMEGFSTVMNRTDWGRGFKLDALLLVEAVLAIGAATLVGIVDLRTVARVIVATGALVAAIAIILTIFYRLHLTGFGVQVDPVTGLCKTYGTMYEANLLGSYLAATLVFSLAVGSYLAPTWFALASRTLLALGIGLTVSRAIWVSVLGGAVLLLGLAVLERLRLRRSQVLQLVVGAGLTLVAWGGLLQLGSSAPCGPVRAAELSTEGSITGRVASNVLAINEWAGAPLQQKLFGLGTGSNRSHLQGDPNQPWISSQAIAAIHDTGVVGFMVVFGLFGLLLWALIWWHRPRAREQRWLRYGLGAAVLTLMVAFQATTGILMMYPWLFLGTALGMLATRSSAFADERQALRRPA